MSKIQIPKRVYADLLKSISVAYSKGLLAAQKALEYQRVKTYWQIGKAITKSAKGSKGALVLGPSLYQSISRDLNTDLNRSCSSDMIGRMVQFARNYPKFPYKTTLNFTQYIALQRLRDVAKRDRLEAEAQKKNLSALEIKARIAQMTAVTDPLPNMRGMTLKMERGELYVYMAHPFSDLNGRQSMCVDLGFKIHIPVNGAIIKGASSLSGNKSRYIRTVKEKGGYHVCLAVRKRNRLYTYAARVLRIVDGDTFDALVDVGFGICMKERFRLKAINTPEINTQEGKKAKAFLEKYLSECPTIVIRTSKAGMYGRWLADVFLCPQCDDPKRVAREGEFLNQVLIDKGFAELY